jgi:hypothetical protein
MRIEVEVSPCLMAELEEAARSRGVSLDVLASVLVEDASSRMKDPDFFLAEKVG